MIRMTLDCIKPTQSMSYGPFTAMLVWSGFFLIYQNFCLLSSLYIHIFFMFHKVE